MLNGNTAMRGSIVLREDRGSKHTPFLESNILVGLSPCGKNRYCFCSTVQRQLESYSCKITFPFHAMYK